MPRILHLILKKKWFDMIASGENKEEYREIKPYWINRLQARGCVYDECRDFSLIEFRNGYQNNCPTMQIEYEGATIGCGKEEWGAEPGKEYYVIKLGKILSVKNYKQHGNEMDTA